MTKADIKKRIDKILILSRNYCSLISDMCYNRGEGVLRTYSSIEKNYRERGQLKILYDDILFHLSEQDIKITAHYITNEFRYIVRSLSQVGLVEHYMDFDLNKKCFKYFEHNGGSIQPTVKIINRSSDYSRFIYESRRYVAFTITHIIEDLVIPYEPFSSIFKIDLNTLFDKNRNVIKRKSYGMKVEVTYLDNSIVISDNDEPPIVTFPKRLGFPSEPNKEFYPKKNEISNSNVNEQIREIVNQQFSYTLKTCPRKNKGQILSEQDYEKLVDAVSYFFENDYKLPEIKEPIKTVNTTKQNIVYSFIELYGKLKKAGQKRPNSLFELIKLLFEPYKNDDISNMRKTKKPTYYHELIK